ncbi:MAG: DUF86 domain-containing protein [Planctomycetes bacterium]|nr:DUF86 domain-containing protein [Planctomycetota bacterium]
MRREELYLADIVEAADAIAQYLAGVDRDTFLKNLEKRDAVLLKLIIIGEAAARVPKELRDRHPQVPWANVIALRNMSVHVYFGIKWEAIWVTASEDTPRLRGLVAGVLAKEFPDRLPFAGGEPQ